MNKKQPILSEFLSEGFRSTITDRFLTPGFDFWFSDHDHIRSPFPAGISEKVKERTSQVFFEWISGFEKNETSRIEDGELVEMFETILFNEAIKLVDDEDQRLTILYPFLPRLGDRVNNPINGPGNIIERKAEISTDQKKVMTLIVSSVQSEVTWETKLELTA